MRRIVLSITFVIATVASICGQVQAQSPVLYKVTFPEAEHHWMQVEMTFSDLNAKPLDVRMSRSSPGRYAVAEFAKNVFQVEAYNGEKMK